MRSRLCDVVACLVLAVLALVCFGRLVAQPDALIVDGTRPSIDYANPGGVRPVGNDVTFLFLINYLQVAEHFPEHGRPPLWDASGFTGRPAVGNPQAGLFYAPLWAAWYFRSPAALGWLTVAHLFWAGLGTYGLARSLRTGRFAALVAAGCYQASPFLLAHTFEGHYPHIWAAAWYPWAFWAFFEYRAGMRRGALALPLALAMAFLTGHPQEWYYLTFALSCWTAVDAALALRARRAREAALILLRWGGLVGLSFGLIAIELLPDMAAQEWTLRSGGLSLGILRRYNPHSVNLLQLLSPAALGGPADYFGHTNYWEALLSIGLVPLILAVIAVARHVDRAMTYAWLTLVLVTTVFAGGPRLGLFMVFYRFVPGMNRFRVPSRAIFLASLGAAVLAGFGIEALRRLAESADDWRLIDRRFRQVAAVVLALLVLGVGFSWKIDSFEGTPPAPMVTPVKKSGGAKLSRSDRTRVKQDDKLEDPPSEEPYRGLLACSQVLGNAVFWSAVLGFGAALAIGRLGERGRRVAVSAAGFLAMAELGTYGYLLFQVAPASRFLGSDPISRALADASQSTPRPFRIHSREQVYDDLRAKANGFEKVKNNDWFEIHYASELYEQLYPLLDRDAPPTIHDAMGITLRKFGRAIRQQVLDRMGAAFLVSDQVDPEASWPLVQTGTWNGQPYVVYKNPTAFPRAFVVPRAYPVKEYAPRELALFRLLDPREAVLMEREPLPGPGARQPYTPADWIPTHDPDRVVVRVNTQAPGLLVVAEAWMPGWTAAVNGRRVPILRGNHAQRVIPLSEAGNHEVVMTYWPPALTRGLAITSLAGMVWLGFCVRLIASRANTARGENQTRAVRALSSPHLSRDRASDSEVVTVMRQGGQR